MLSDRRKDRRQVINRAAKLQAELGALPRDCIITDLSRSGARIFADGIEVPDNFALLISGSEETRRDCRVVWRLGGEVGLEFTGPSQPMRRP